MNGGRIPEYYKYKDKLSVEEYVEKVQCKEIYDPVLTTQLSNGFVLKRIIKSYISVFISLTHYFNRGDQT